MGRLDDIVARNRRAVDADNPVVGVLDGLGDNKPDAPVARFTLPSQRKSGTAVWKVLVLMVLLGTVFGIYECRLMDVTKRDDERRLREVK
jgi:hypothetical protein